MESKRLAVWEEKLAAHVENWRDAGSPVAGSTPVADLAKPAGCFGQPGARNDNSPICKGCQHAVKCRKTCAAIDAELRKLELATGEPQTFADKKAAAKKERNAKAAAHMRGMRAREKSCE